MSVLYLVSASSAKAGLSLGGAIGDIVWGTTWFLSSVVVNILVTGLISYKLIRAQRRLGSVLNAHRVRVYSDIVAILIESALPFTVLGIVAGVVNAADSELISSNISDALDEAWFAFCVRMLHSCDDMLSANLAYRHFLLNSSYSAL